MAHVLTLTDGITTVNLTAGSGCMVQEYTPDSPTLTMQEGGGKQSDFDDITSVTLRNVTDTIELMLEAANVSALQTLINNIERLCWAANWPQLAPLVYFNVQVNGESSAWKARVRGARLKLQPRALAVGWPNRKVAATLYLTRHAFVGPTEAVPISSQATGGSATTAGAAIHNHDDVGEGNRVNIAAGVIKGVLPALAKIQLTNTSVATKNYNNLYFANNAFGGGSDFQHIYEGESAQSGSGTSVADAGASNGSYMTQVGTVNQFKWLIPGSQFTMSRGKFFRILVRFSAYTTTTPIYVRPVLLNNLGLTELFRGAEIQLPEGSVRELIDLGAVPLPAGGAKNIYADCVLAFYFRSAIAVTTSIDFFQLTSMDSYRHIIQRGYGIPNNGTITDDGIENFTHSAGNAIYTPRGGPLVLFPVVAQSISFLHDLSNGTAPPGDICSVQLWQAPRRLTV